MRDGIRRAALTSVVLLLAAGCGNGAVGEVIDEPPTAAPLVEEQALWDISDDGAVDTVRSAVLHGETAIVYTDEQDGHRLAAIDAATGEPRWSVGDGPLPGGNGAEFYTDSVGYRPLVTGPPDDFLVVVPYRLYDDGCSRPDGLCPDDERQEFAEIEHGVAALSGTDGSVRWMTPVHTETEDDRDDMMVRLLAAGESLVLVAVAGYHSSAGTLRALALNPSDGHELWQQPGVVPEFIVDETVIGRIPALPDDVGTVDDLGMLCCPGTGTRASTVVALDAASGSRRWDLGQRFTGSWATLAAGDLVVVHATRDTDEHAPVHTLLLEASTGNEVVRLGETTNSCATDARSLVACRHSDTLITFRFDERTVRAAQDPIGQREIDGVWRGLVFVRDDPDVSTATLVDRSANVITERLPGELKAISDRYAIFRTSGEGDIAVHAVKP